MPHAGLQRKLAQERGMVGNFPLHAYTELTLKAFATLNENGKERTVILSGHRCLHFVRAYCRPSDGRLVSSYWRGDPALGIKRTKYRVSA